MAGVSKARVGNSLWRVKPLAIERRVKVVVLCVWEGAIILTLLEGNERATSGVRGTVKWLRDVLASCKGLKARDGARDIAGELARGRRNALLGDTVDVGFELESVW